MGDKLEIENDSYKLRKDEWNDKCDKIDVFSTSESVYSILQKIEGSDKKGDAKESKI